MKLRLGVISKEICSFRPKSPLEVEKTVCQPSNPSEPMGTPNSDQTVALGQIAKDGVTIDAVLHDRTLVFDRFFGAQRRLLSLAMGQWKGLGRKFWLRTVCWRLRYGRRLLEGKV